MVVPFENRLGEAKSLMQLIWFVGRFHVLIVHLPLGILTLAVALEILVIPPVGGLAAVLPADRSPSDPHVSGGCLALVGTAREDRSTGLQGRAAGLRS